MNEPPPRSVRVELRAHADHPVALAHAALCAARAGARVVLLRNTTTDAVATQEALEGQRLSTDHPLLFCVRGTPTLHHPHFAREDRIALDEALAARLGRRASQRRGCVVVAAEAAEQSHDLDADFLLTDLAPMRILLRRLEAVHRHRELDPFRVPGFRAASAVVLLRDEPIDVHLGLGEAEGEGAPRTEVAECSRPSERVGRVCFAHRGLRGPFGAELRELDLPWAVARGIHAAAKHDASDVEVEPSEGGNVIRFAVGPERLVYDRWGLRRAL